MTVVPLVFSLVVTGIASAASTASAGGVTRRALLLFVVLLLFSALAGALLALLPPDTWSPPAGALEATRTGLAASEIPEVPPIAEWFRTLILTNVVAAAAEGAIVPLAIFAFVFGRTSSTPSATSQQTLR